MGVRSEEFKELELKVKISQQPVVAAGDYYIFHSALLLHGYIFFLFISFAAETLI